MNYRYRRPISWHGNGPVRSEAKWSAALNEKMPCGHTAGDYREYPATTTITFIDGQFVEAKFDHPRYRPGLFRCDICGTEAE